MNPLLLSQTLRHVTVSLLLQTSFFVFALQATEPWSGTVVYDVEPLNIEASGWDYLPKTITYETNGEDWRITEQGTSFERIWIGSFEASEYHVLFHFLGHAVELLEPCPASPSDDAVECYEHYAPCPWPMNSLPKSCTLHDGPASYLISAREKVETPPRNWGRNAFQLPAGYEPVDRLTLAALLSKIARSTD